MAKANKSVLSNRATNFRAALKRKGYDVPHSVLMEIFAQEEGFKSYSAYKAVRADQEKTMLTLPVVETPPAPALLTETVSLMKQKLRLVLDDDSGEWKVIPFSATAYYEMTEASELLGLMLSDEVVNPFGDCLVSFWSLAPATIGALTCNIWVVCPNVTKYGLPPLIEAPEVMDDVPAQRPDCEFDMLDTGDDSGGASVIEILVSDELFALYQAKQSELFNDKAQALLEDMRMFARKRGFSFDPATQQYEEVHTSQYPLALPEFKAAFDKAAGL